MPDHDEVDRAPAGPDEPDSTHAPDEPLPHRIGRFVILGRLGRGGMGSVLRAYDEALDRQVAVKVMLAEHAENRRMLREAQALARLSHPNVVQVYEVGETDGSLFIAMELIAGRTLDQWQRDRHPWRRCVEVYRQAARGLAAAHASGLVHRDFKPSNCILDEAERVRVLDFGLARLDDERVEDDEAPGSDASSERLELPLDRSYDEDGGQALREALTRTGSMMGTIAYMAPEQTRGRNVDARSDQFSFCVSLYEALYGQPPFADNPMPQLLKMAFGRPVAPRPAPAGSRVPPWLFRLLARGLHGQPEERWASMEAVIAELDRHERRSWVRWGSWSLAAAVGGALMSNAAGPTEPSCEDAAGPVDEAWNDEHRARVQAAIEATALPYADQTWLRLEPRLSDYAGRLATAHAEACRQRDQIDGSYRRCLGTRARTLQRTVTLLEDADQTVVEQAVELVAGLPPVEGCAEGEARDSLLAAAPEPSPKADEVREQLDLARVLTRAGRSTKGLEELAPAVEQAEALGDPLVLAQARLTAGFVLMHDGQLGSAERRLQQALEGALGHGSDPVALEAATSLAYLVGVDRAKTEAGLWLGSVAMGIAERHDPRGTLQAEALTVVAQVLAARGETDEALAHYERALQILAAEAGEDDLSLVVALNGLGQTLAGLDQLDRAQSHYERALAIRIDALGDRHPQVAYQRINLANVLVRRADLDAAEQQFLLALDVLRELPTQHGLLAQLHTNLGVLRGRQGLAEQGEEHLRLAIEHWQALYGSDHLFVAKALTSLGANLQRRDLHDGAAAQYLEALRIVEQGERTPAKDELRARVLRALGRTRHEQGRLEDAEEHYGKGIELLDTAADPDPELLAKLLLYSGRALHERGDHATALLRAERALELLQTRLHDERLETKAIGLRDDARRVLGSLAP